MIKWLKKFFHPKKQIIMIAALQNDRGIGYQGDLIHQSRNDMKHFVDQTLGHTVIMGRKNWESIPKKYRPMKKRQNIIVTRDRDYLAPGALVVDSLEKAISKSNREKIYIIGGGQIYNLGLKYASTLDLAIIDSNQRADVFFPEFKTLFKQEEITKSYIDPDNGLPYQYELWKRK